MYLTALKEYNAFYIFHRSPRFTRKMNGDRISFNAILFRPNVCSVIN